MDLTEKDRQFLARRRKLVRMWPLVGTILLIGFVGFGAWLLWTKPLLVNPYVVVARLDSGPLSPSTTSLMASLLPLATLMCLVLSVAVILFAFAAISNEKKYMAIIEKLDDSAGRSTDLEPQ